MSLPTAIAIVALACVIGNRIVSVLIGLILKVPPSWLLSTVILIDLVQIPLYYWLYEHGSTWLEKLPLPFRHWFKQDLTQSDLGRWTRSLGGLGVFLISALPGLGGGIWSAVFLAHSLRLRKTWGYFLSGMGSVMSYAALFWVLDTLVKTVRYFSA